MSPSHFYDFGSFRVDPEQRLLLRHGQLVALTPKAFDTLLLLVENHGRVVDKQTLMKCVWPDSFVEEGSLARNISVLRKLLEEGVPGHQYIETIPKRGYRFVAHVRRVEPNPYVTDAQSERHIDQLTGSSVSTGPTSLSHHRRLIVSMVTLGSIALGAILLLKSEDHRQVRASSHLVGIRSLAVLPLANLSHDPDQEYFADGMTEALITDLAKIKSLRIVSRTSVMQYKNSQKPLKQIARELGVDGVVEGTVLRSGGKVRVTAQLIRVDNDEHLWAEMYERNIEDALILQGEVAQTIADQVRIQLLPGERERLSQRSRMDPVAYELYLRGRYYWNKRDANGIRQALDYFQQAIARDPNFALGYAGLADAHIVSTDSFAIPPREALNRAKAAAIRALSLDDQLAEAHASLAWVHFQLDWDWVGADNEFRRAIELNPGYATAHHWYAQYLAALGRTQEAADEMARAQQLDPLSLIIRLDAGAVDYWGGRLDSALQRELEVIQMDPNYVRAYFYLAISYADKRMLNESLVALRKGIQLAGPDSNPYSEIEAWIYASDGRRSDALNVINQVQRLTPKHRIENYYLAEAFAALGNRDQAFEWLEKAYQEHTYWMVYLKVDPRLEPLRADPRFQQLVQRVGLG